jgi:hypothetical protein
VIRLGPRLTTKATDMMQKHLVTCPRCGFPVTDQGDVGNPGLTGDVRAFTRTCEHTDEVLASADERPFGCCELLEAVHGAASPEKAGVGPSSPHGKSGG